MAITITSGGFYTVDPGEIYIIAASASGKVTFVADSGDPTPVDFTIEVNDDNANHVTIETGGDDCDLSPSVEIADNVTAEYMNFNFAKAADAEISAGEGVTVNNICGSQNGVDTITFGDDAVICGDIYTKGGDDVLEFGDDATFYGAFKTGGGSDDVVLGEGASFGSGTIDLSSSSSGGSSSSGVIGLDNDTIRIGDGADFKKLVMGEGDDVAYVGELDTTHQTTVTLDGGSDSYGSSSSGTIDEDCLFLDVSWLSPTEKAAFLQALEDNDYVFDPIVGGYVPEGSGEDSETITFMLDDGTKLKLKGWEQIKAVCFARGTQILTPRGEVPIESLKPGDLVLTMDQGYRELRWIGSTVVPCRGHLASIRIKAGTFGNSRDVRVSPQHRILLKGAEIEMLMGEHEALVPAKHLVDGKRVVVEEADSIEYFHILFDDHEIVFAEGMPSESFHPGAVGLDGMAEEARREIFELFPELEQDVAAYGQSCRVSLKGHEAKVATRRALEAAL